MNIKKLCCILARIEIILGAIGSFVVAEVMGKTRYYTSYKVIEEQNGFATVAYFVSCMFGVLILYAILEGLAESLENQEQIFALLDKQQSTTESIKKEVAHQTATSESKPILNPVPEKKKEVPAGGYDHHSEYNKPFDLEEKLAFIKCFAKAQDIYNYVKRNCNGEQYAELLQQLSHATDKEEAVNLIQTFIDKNQQ